MPPLPASRSTTKRSESTSPAFRRVGTYGSGGEESVGTSRTTASGTLSGRPSGRASGRALSTGLPCPDGSKVYSAIGPAPR